MSNINNSKLQELLDKQAVTEVLYQYCRGADRCDEELIEITVCESVIRLQIFNPQLVSSWVKSAPPC